MTTQIVTAGGEVLLSDIDWQFIPAVGDYYVADNGKMYRATARWFNGSLL